MCDESKQLEIFENIPDTEKVPEIDDYDEFISIRCRMLRDLSTTIKSKNDE